MTTDRTMTLYHVTHEDNWFGVVEHGLLTARARDRRKAIWLVTESNQTWASSHVLKTHPGWTPESLVTFVVTVRRSWLRKTRMRGVWYCVEDIPPNRIIDSEVTNDWTI